MIDTACRHRIEKLPDDDLERQMSSAYNAAYYESFGRDHEAHADAIQLYEMFAREWKRRRGGI